METVLGADAVVQRYADMDPAVASVAIDVATGESFAGASLGNSPDVQTQVEDMQSPLKEAWKMMLRLMGNPKGLTNNFITNCAEFQAINAALKKGAKIENIIIRSVKTANQSYIAACPNCHFWLRKLGIRIVEGDYTP